MTESIKSQSSVHGGTDHRLAKVTLLGCVYNLVDLIALWGTEEMSRDMQRKLERFDEKLGVLLLCCGEADLLILTA